MGCEELINIDVSKIKRSSGAVQELIVSVDLPPVLSETEQIVFDEPVQLQLKLANIGNAISVEGNIRAKLRLSCGNCLENFSLPVEAQLKEVFYNQAQVEVKPGEEWIPYTGDQLDLTPEAVKSLLMVLPMRLVCSEDCKGLCPVCGVNKNREECNCSVDNVDPRLAALRKLLEQDQK